jgi:hypothetical protein
VRFEESINKEEHIMMFPPTDKTYFLKKYQKKTKFVKEVPSRFYVSDQYKQHNKVGIVKQRKVENRKNCDTLYI